MKRGRWRVGRGVSRAHDAATKKLRRETMLPREVMISSSVKEDSEWVWVAQVSHPVGVFALPPIAVFGAFLPYNGLANVTSCRGRSSSSLLCSETGAPIRNFARRNHHDLGTILALQSSGQCYGRPAIWGVKQLTYAGLLHMQACYICRLGQRQRHQLFCRNRQRLLRISAPYENISGGEYSGHRSAGWRAYACSQDVA
jgi:hypothetical protein